MVLIEIMASFKKKKYTDPVICKHSNDVSNDWYIFFRFKHEGKVYKYKKREGVNRIKELNERVVAIDKLLEEIAYDLRHGWNPLLDPKRENEYSPYAYSKNHLRPKRITMQERMQKYNIRGAKNKD